MWKLYLHTVFFLSGLGRILVSSIYDKLFWSCSHPQVSENMSDFPELVDLRGGENEDILNILI